MPIRAEQENDIPAIRQVHKAAFETDVEAALVDALRGRVDPLISLVAEDQGEVVGHILFSPCSIGSAKVMGLAPVAVLPEQQKRGCGSALVRAGLDRCRELGFEAVIVLGHTEFYQKFGFVPASRFGLRSEFDVPDEVFMAIGLQPGALDDVAGLVKYHPAFADL